MSQRFRVCIPRSLRIFVSQSVFQHKRIPYGLLTICSTSLIEHAMDPSFLIPKCVPNYVSPKVWENTTKIIYLPLPKYCIKVIPSFCFDGENRQLIIKCLYVLKQIKIRVWPSYKINNWLPRTFCCTQNIWWTIYVFI